MIACPGHNYRTVGKPPMRERIIHDLREVQNWGGAGVVSLVESTEMHSLDIGQLPQILSDVRLWWRHLPIRDRDVPGYEFERAWEVEGRWIRDRLREGERVVLHCHAGLGRTGTIAARLLIEFGVGHDQAIEWVRAARPGTIETRFQEDYVRGLLSGELPSTRRRY
jgi:ADP-ribosyl-[dinitrogen reductase] hydrolase